MRIANPIYDVVFKYLMEDIEVAKILVSAILNLQIDELTLQSQEVALALPDALQKKDSTINVMRMDFKAKIRLGNNEQILVLIELQKAKVLSEIGRFRRYLGSQYISKENLIKTESHDTAGIPIISIYLLGYKLDHFSDTPIINIKRQYIDNYDSSVLEGKELFVESLTHDSVVVQVPALKNKRRSKLEKLLGIFTSTQEIEQEFSLSEFPNDYQLIVDRLSYAIMNETLREALISEKEYLDEFMSKISSFQDQIESANRQIEFERQQKDEVTKQKDEMFRSMRTTALNLKEAGFSIVQIAAFLGKEEEEVTNLLNSK